MLDLIVILVIACYAFNGYRKGFVRTIFNLLSMLVSFFLTNQIYPFVAKLLNNATGIHEAIKKIVSEAFGFSVNNILVKSVGKADVDFINSLALPDFFKSPLIENNNPEVYRMLDALNIQDYVANFMASMIINAIAMILVFIVLSVLMQVVSVALDIVTMLPIISSFNKVGGIAIGIFEGVLIIFVGLALCSILFSVHKSFPFNDLLEQSVLAKFIQEKNFILSFITQIFK